MSAYLARLKQIEREKNSIYVPDTVPSKPSKAPFEPFEGDLTGGISENIFVTGEDVPVASVAIVSVANPGEEETDKTQTDASPQRVEEMLSNNPTLKYAVLVDDATTDPVTVSVGIRGLATFELSIPLSRYDGIALLQVIEQYSMEETGCGNTQASPEAKKATKRFLTSRNGRQHDYPNHNR